MNLRFISFLLLTIFIFTVQNAYGIDHPPQGFGHVDPIFEPPETTEPYVGERNLGLKFHSGYPEFAEQGRPLKFFITNLSNDIPRIPQTIAIYRAIDIWEVRQGLIIEEFFDPDFSVKADWFEIKFVKGSQMLNPGAFAEAFRGTVQVNDDWFYALEPESAPRNLEYIIAHELGHAMFGLLHSNSGQCPLCLMNPFYADRKPVLQDFEIHDVVLDNGVNQRWETEPNFRNWHQSIWNLNLNSWYQSWLDLKNTQILDKLIVDFT